MSFASLARNIALLSTLIVAPVLSYSADFKELWKEKGGTVKESAKSSSKSPESTGPSQAGQNEKSGSSISRQPEQVDRQAPAKPSPLKPATGDVGPKESVKRVQALLWKLGYDPGPIDGVLGAQTRTVIKTFQEHVGMPSTGEVDDRLIAQLELEVDRRKKPEKIEPKIERATPESDKRIPAPPVVLPKMPGPLASQELRPQDVYRKVKDSVVLLVAAKSRKEISQGSAVAISPRHLLTNYHVIRNQPFILVKLDEQIIKARLAKKDEERDVCILVLEESKLTPIKGVRRFQDLEVGEKAYTVGAPSGLELTLGEGIISGKREEGHRKFIQTSAPISPGSSGGGLFDSYGNLIGITTFVVKDAQNLNFAISVEEYWE